MKLAENRWKAMARFETVNNLKYIKPFTTLLTSSLYLPKNAGIE